MRHALKGIFWVSVYVVVALSPLVVARVGAPRPGQGFVTDFSVALGFVALSIMVLQFGLVARLQRVSAPFGMDALIQYHRQIGYGALAFAVAHPLLVFANDPSKLWLLDFFGRAPNRARFAVGSLVLLGALIATSVWRKELRLRYEAWQVLHGLLAVAVIGLGLAHAAGVGYYAASPLERALWLCLAGVVVGTLAWLRIIKPLGHAKRAWRVRDVRPERGGAWTVLLEPHGHGGMRFEPGQFGWLMLDQSPFTVSTHPFSFSSSAETPTELAITIKARGDFSGTIKEVKPGVRAFVDGPYGLFTTDKNEGMGFILVAGGVGITPLMSMLRTMADREDRRPVVLFYGSRDWESITFREQLEQLQDSLHLEVIHVLEKPHAGWDGESGFIDASLLRRHLPRHFERYRCFVCGPVPMMDAMEHALVEVGIDDEHVHTERFEMV